MNIKNKIITSISTISLLSLIITGTLFYIFISNIIENGIDEAMSSTLNNNISITTEWVNSKIKNFKIIKETIQNIVPEGTKNPKYLSAYKIDKEVTALFIAYDDKTMITEDKLPPGFDPTVRPWFIDAKQKNDLIITNPFIDKVKGGSAISFAMPISFENNLKGVIAENIRLTDLIDYVDKVKFLGDGYVYILDGKNIFVSHPNKELLGKNSLETGVLEELSKKIANNPEGKEKYVYENSNKIALWKPIPGTDWKMIATVNLDIAYQEKKQAVNLFLLIFFSTLGLSILTGILIAKSIGKPLAEITKNCEFIAQGDFTTEIDEQLIKRKDEIGLLAVGFKKIEQSVNSMFKETLSSIQNITNSSVYLSDKIRDINKGAQIQAESSLNIASATNNFGNSMNQVLDNVRNQVAGIEETASSISEISENVNNVAKNAELTRKSSDVAAISSKAGNEKILISLKSMEEMEVVTKQIEDVVKKITSISEQTNLLALNAAIEAARAGEAGRGFAVVADEVKKLAEESNNFTESIVDLIKDMRDKSATNYKLSKFVGESLRDINEKVLSTNLELKNVSEAMLNQDNSIKEINEAMENISNGSSNVEILIMEEIESLTTTAKEIDAIAGVAKDTAGETEKILQFSLKLSEEANKIKLAMNKFKIR